jgi:glutamate N-acetyltransferase/amino-acid N-acetyltransferase
MSEQQVAGFRAAGVHAGLKPQGKPDMALIVSERPCTAAGVFTTNRVKAAPVLYDQALLAQPEARVRAVVVNTGSANACTGQQGLENARRTARKAAEVLGCRAEEVLVLSTGVIGTHLPMETIEAGVEALAGALSAEGWQQAAAAMMTTDTRPKFAVQRVAAGYSVLGVAKGAGMIAPHMATMLAVLVTDAVVPRDVLGRALQAAAAHSFNRIVVDGDMSTNDTVLVLANGASGVAVDEAAFTRTLTEVCVPLAQAIVRDGEGATKFVTVRVSGAPSEAEALTCARAIATSALVKTAFYGADPNWGRILSAAGYSGVPFDPARAALWLKDGARTIQLVAEGAPLDYDEGAAIALMQGPEWEVHLDLGAGEAETWLWTCDLSHEYVTINSHYRT